MFTFEQGLIAPGGIQWTSDPNLWAPFVTSIHLITGATFVQQKLLLSGKSNFCWTKVTFVGQKYFCVIHGVTKCYILEFCLDKIAFVNDSMDVTNGAP